MGGGAGGHAAEVDESSSVLQSRDSMSGLQILEFKSWWFEGDSVGLEGVRMAPSSGAKVRRQGWGRCERVSALLPLRWFPLCWFHVLGSIVPAGLLQCWCSCRLTYLDLNSVFSVRDVGCAFSAWGCGAATQRVVPTAASSVRSGNWQLWIALPCWNDETTPA